LQTERQLYGRGGPQHDALPIEGFGPFLQAGVRMAYGSDSKPYREARVSNQAGRLAHPLIIML
jgi:aspartate aminotransferase